MKKIFFLVAGFISLCSLTNAQTADDVVNKYVEAVGGKDKLTNVKSVRLTGKMPAGQGMEFPFTITIKNQEAMRFEMTIQGKSLVQVIQGDSGWSINPFASMGGKADAERMTQDEVKEQDDQLDITGELFDYNKKGYAIEFMGKEEVEGTDAYKLKVTKKDNEVFYDFVDAESNLLIKQEAVRKMQDKEIKVDTYFSNYKLVDGIMFPLTISVKAPEMGDAATQTMNYDTVEFNVSVDNSMFKMPAKS